MQRLTVTLACGRYDRVQDLTDGLVDTDGIALRPVHPLGGPPEIFFRATRYREFDACELSFSSYVTTLDSAERPFVAIPVFLSRAFRHGNIFVNEAAGISEPQDLNGKRIGVSEYGTSASVWIRGMLKDEYGLDPKEMEWYSRREEKIDVERGGLRVHPLPSGSLTDHLSARTVDAVLGSMKLEGPRIRRLFLDYREREAEYYERTGIFPIMHVLALRRDFYEQHPWVARTLYRAFSEARLRCEERMQMTSTSPYLLPWVTAYVEEQHRRFGTNIWTYGHETNRTAIERFAHYAYEQGLTSRLIDSNEMFVPYRHTNNEPKFDW